MPRLAAGLVLLCTSVSPALSQPAGDIPIDTFRPAIDSRGMLTINASQTLGHGELSFGLGSLAWGHDMLAFEDGENRYSVDDVITATLIAAVGIELGPVRFQLGASVPLTVLSGDRGPDNLGELDNANDDQNFGLDGQGVGNIGLHLKTRFLSSSRHGVGLGAIASLYLPTVSPAERFLGDKQLAPQLIGILDKELGRRGRFRVALNGGIRMRSTTTFVDLGDMGAPATNQQITASAELPLGLGLAYAVSPQKFDVVAEVFGAIPLGDHENYQPSGDRRDPRLYLARNSSCRSAPDAGSCRPRAPIPRRARSSASCSSQASVIAMATA